MAFRHIQTWVLAGILGFLLPSCGATGPEVGPSNPSTDCTGGYNGFWNGNTGGGLTLGTNCTVSISMTGACTSTGSYLAMLGSFGTTEFTVTALSGTSPCLGLGSHRCSYVFAGSQLSLNCGLGDYVYYR